MSVYQCRQQSHQDENGLAIIFNEAYQACRDIYDNGGNGFLAYENLARHVEDEDEIASIDDTVRLKELINYATRT